MLDRRTVLIASLNVPWALRAEEAALPWLRQGGVVLAMRHALAPGTFDPPGFKLGVCSSQRNLNDVGREQARQAGRWLSSRDLKPVRVRSSPWCRCLDTANLAFGQAESWDALASPTDAPAALREARLSTLRLALKNVPTGRFEAWVTHQFVLQDLAGPSTAPAEALVLRAQGEQVAVLASLNLG